VFGFCLSLNIVYFFDIFKYTYFMTNEALVAKLIRTKILKTPHLIEALLNVDRRDFVQPEHQDLAYEDSPLSIGEGATISQPTTVAFMLELLQPQPGHKILDVGSGSGWTTALLAEIVSEKGRVIGLELIPELVEFGRTNLNKYSYSNAEIWQAGKKIGAQDSAPFDRILVSAAAVSVPDQLIQQLKPGGIMVLPVQNSVVKVEKISDTQSQMYDFPGFAFVPLK
jgi:protein-L-isoaspartate(D-aspartate) O-methyltransferase